MVERFNGTIKKGTILKENYKNTEGMSNALLVLQVHYILYKRHEGLGRELNALTL